MKFEHSSHLGSYAFTSGK